jgi:endonuclease/exonuclease/phosphatase family metal-dependent hydrolase
VIAHRQPRSPASDALVNVRGVGVRVIDTHLQSQHGCNPLADADREQQVRHLLEAARVQDTDATVLLGDLNDVPAWSGFAPPRCSPTSTTRGPRRVTARPDTSRPIRARTAASTTCSSPRTSPSARRARWRLESDHRPVVAELRLPGAAVGVSAERP